MAENANASQSSFLQIASDRVNKICEMALFTAMALMTLVTALQIVFRIWFRALTWSEEVTCFLLVAASFFGTAVAFKRGAHIAVTFLVNTLPAALKKLVLLAVDFTGIAFFAVLVWYGGVLCIQEASQMATSINISMSWIYLIFPVTGLISIIHLLAHSESIIKGAE